MHHRRRHPRPYPIVNDPVPRDLDRYDVPPNDPAPNDFERPPVVDPPPPPIMAPDPLPPDFPSAHKATSDDKVATTRLIDQWRDTSPRRAMRSDDLPMHQPPNISLDAWREDGVVRVHLLGGPERISLRWEGDGVIDGDGRDVRWTPSTPMDQIRVAVRSDGGVAIVALMATRV